jgi:hypothetical protein
MWAYELIEGQTGNLIASFDSEQEALVVVAGCVRRDGPQSVASVALMRVDTEDEDGAMETVAFGTDLIALVRQLV